MAAPPIAADEEIVAGRRPVEEAFVARRGARRLLVTPQRRQALEKIVLHATSLRIPIVEVEGGTLTAVAGFDGHQGVALVVEARRYATLDEILARAGERGEPPFVLVLDSLEDPQNVGTLLRSAESAGVHGVLFPTKRQAPLSPAAVKASAGAVEHLLLAPVDDLAGALADLHIRGLNIVGAEAEAPLTARQADLRGPLALVVGSEGQGLGPTIRRRTDLLVRIPMRGAIGSLNASVAGSILLFEALAQRDPEGTGSVPAAPVGARAKSKEASAPEVARGLATDAAPVAPAGPPAAVPAAPAATARATAVAESPAAKASAAKAPKKPKASVPATAAGGGSTATKAPAAKPRAANATAADPPAAKAPAPKATKAPATTKPKPAKATKTANPTAAETRAAPATTKPKAAKAAKTAKTAKGSTVQVPARPASRTRAPEPAVDEPDDGLLPGGPRPS